MKREANKRNLKLMPDYYSYPLWEETEGGYDNVDPAEIPISPGLKNDLISWAQKYDDTLDRDDPRQSGFPTPEAEAAFKAEGEALLARLKAELGQQYIFSVHI